jgi:hypothetical protein
VNELNEENLFKDVFIFIKDINSASFIWLIETIKHSIGLNFITSEYQEIFNLAFFFKLLDLKLNKYTNRRVSFLIYSEYTFGRYYADLLRKDYILTR